MSTPFIYKEIEEMIKKLALACKFIGKREDISFTEGRCLPSSFMLLDSFQQKLVNN